MRASMISAVIVLSLSVVFPGSYAGAEDGVTAHEIVIGMSTALSGSLCVPGHELQGRRGSVPQQGERFRRR